jgi:DNA-binding transcriptional LysR family regulator
MRSINLHQLATFQVVAKHCSYVRAAEELHFSQPAVSAQIRQLEEAMGVKLFDKIGRKTHLTQAGEELYLYSQKIFSLIDETLETMASLRSPYYGRLSVGADTTVGTYVIPGILGKFHHIYPEVDITLEVVNRVYLVDALANNRIDMVIMGKVPSDLPVFSAPFAANELVVVAPPTHRLAGCKRVPFAELAREHFLLREVGSGTRAALENAFQEAGLPLQVSMQVGNNSAIKQGVAAGLGIALISRVALDIELETNRLVILDVEGFPIMRQWYLVHLKEKNLSSTARAFKSFILQHADIFMQEHALQAPARRQGNGLVRIVQERE